MPESTKKAVRFVEPGQGSPPEEAGPGETTTTLLLDGDIDGAAAFQRNEDGTVEAEAKVNVNYKSTRTLDSDDEEEEKYERLDVEQIEGQEDDTIVKDGEIKITPFNMREEMEEGHFDSEGNFIFNKDNELKDNWLDAIEWDKAKEIAGRHWQIFKQLDEAEDQAGPSEIELYEIYDRLGAILAERETVTKALKRLGKGTTAGDARKKRWAEVKPDDAPSTSKEMETSDVSPNKPDGQMDDEPGLKSEPEEVEPAVKPELEEPEPTAKLDDDDAIFAKPHAPKRARVETEPGMEPKPKPKPHVPDEREKAILELTELVDRLVSSGEYEAYGFTKEQVLYKRDTLRMKRVKAEDTEEVKEEIDMFDEEFDEKDVPPPPSSKSPPPPAPASNSVQWEFKWTQEDAAVHGPFSSEAMLEWTENKYFEKGVFVRRADQPEGQFYTSKRMDFELYC